MVITSPTDMLFLICFCDSLRWERLHRLCFWQSWEELSRQAERKLLIPGLLTYLSIWTMSYHVRVFMLFLENLGGFWVPVSEVFMLCDVNKSERKGCLNPVFSDLSLGSLEYDSLNEQDKANIKRFTNDLTVCDANPQW